MRHGDEATVESLRAMVAGREAMLGIGTREVVTPLTHDDAVEMACQVLYQRHAARHEPISPLLGRTVNALLAVDVASREQARAASTAPDPEGIVEALRLLVSDCRRVNADEPRERSIPAHHGAGDIRQARAALAAYDAAQALRAQPAPLRLGHKFKERTETPGFCGCGNPESFHIRAQPAPEPALPLGHEFKEGNISNLCGWASRLSAPTCLQPRAAHAPGGTQTPE